MNTCAALQMVSGPDIEVNFIAAESLIAEAAQAGVKLVALPENFALMGLHETDKLKAKERDGVGPIQDFLKAMAIKYSLWIIGGTIPIAAENSEKVRAACLVYNEQGERMARYDKIHLFDVAVPGSTESYRESDTIEPGSAICVVPTPFGMMGVAVCYDLRFPEMFRRMTVDAMDFLIVPAAFTAKTGAAHWEILLRARAVENLCYVVAPNQGGLHANGRQTFGHSMTIDPWGEILSCVPEGRGMATAKLDLVHLQSVRHAFPALTHRRLNS
jgi:predicted amidohydrolase